MKKQLGTRKQRAEVLMEEMDRKIDLILEHTSSLRSLPPRVGKIEEKLEKVSIDVDAIKVGQRLLQEDVSAMKHDIKEVNRKLDQKADTSELKDLERRVLHAA